MRLLPQRAAYLVDAGLLLVADLHLGKAQSFRRLAIGLLAVLAALGLARAVL